MAPSTAQPAQPTIGPIDDFLLPLTDGEELAGPVDGPNPVQDYATDQEPVLSDFLNDDAYLDVSSDNLIASNNTEFGGVTDDWWQARDQAWDYNPVGQPAPPAAPGVMLSSGAGAHEAFDFDESLSDPALRREQMQPSVQAEQLQSSDTMDGGAIGAPAAPEASNMAPFIHPSSSPQTSGPKLSRPAKPQAPLHDALKANSYASHLAEPQPALLDALKAKFQSSHRSGAPQLNPAALDDALQTSQTDSNWKSKQRNTARAVPASVFETPTMQPASMSQSPGLPGMTSPQIATPTSIPKPQKPRKKADRKDMPRTTVSTNVLLITGEQHAKQLAIQRVPLQVQQDDSEQVVANAHYWIPLIANAFDAAFQAQPDRPEAYTEAGLAEWTRWQEEHDDKVQALLFAHPEPQALVQACAFLFLTKVLEAHENAQGPIHVLRTVAVGGSNPHLKCSDRVRAAITTLETFPIVRYDLMRAERLVDFAANPKGFGERKVENLWINYAKKRDRAPHLKKEMPLEAKAAAPAPAHGVPQGLATSGQVLASTQQATTSGTSVKPAPSTPAPHPGPSQGMMHPSGHLAGQKRSPYPASMQPPVSQHMTHTRPATASRLQQMMMPPAKAPPQPPQMSPPRQGLMKAAPRPRVQTQAGSASGNSVVGINVSGSGRAEVMMSDKAMGKKRKVDDLGGEDASEMGARDGKRRG